MPIGEVARRTGVTVPTLRAWERRYELLLPVRTARHRRYSDEDVQRVLAVLKLTGQGWGVGAAARRVAGRRSAAAPPCRLPTSSVTVSGAPWTRPCGNYPRD